MRDGLVVWVWPPGATLEQLRIREQFRYGRPWREHVAKAKRRWLR